MPTILTRSQIKLFVKDDLGVDDVDWSAPGADQPPESRQFVLQEATINTKKLAFGVTFRNALGVEVAGTFKMDVLLRYPAATSAGPLHLDSARPSWKKIGELTTAKTSLAPAELDLGRNGLMAVRLHTLTAVGATHAVVAVEPWGGH